MKHCPNCGGEAVELKDNKLMCLACNVTVQIEVDGSAKPVDTDPLDKIQERIAALESKETAEHEDEGTDCIPQIVR
jgi:uncharacterized Zn finger protein (UPF0148 family)